MTQPDWTDEALDRALSRLGQWTKLPYGGPDTHLSAVVRLADDDRARRRNREALREVLRAAGAPVEGEASVTQLESLTVALTPAVTPLGAEIHTAINEAAGRMQHDGAVRRIILAAADHVGTDGNVEVFQLAAELGLDLREQSQATALSQFVGSINDLRLQLESDLER